MDIQGSEIIDIEINGRKFKYRWIDDPSKGTTIFMLFPDGGKVEVDGFSLNSIDGGLTIEYKI